MLRQNEANRNQASETWRHDSMEEQATEDQFDLETGTYLIK